MTEDITVIPEALTGQGKPVARGGNRPLLLSDPAKVWIVQTGYADIFAVPVENGKASGARTHVFRAKQGSVVFGMDLSSGRQTMGLLLVGSTGTVLLELSRSVFLDAVASDPAAHAARINNWASGLLLGIANAGVMPRDTKAVTPGSSESFNETVSLCPSDDFAWVTVTRGSARAMGRRDWPVIKDNQVVPLPDGGWLVTEGACSLTVSDTPGLVRDGKLKKVLDAFHGFVLKGITLNETISNDVELERMERREKQDDAILKKAISLLTFILQPRKSKVVLLVNKENPELAACRMVAGAGGLAVVEPTAEMLDDTAGMLDTISRLSRFRFREVILKGSWWKRDNGPLLAYLEESKQPVALIPVTARKYELYDPVSGEILPVTPEQAECIAAKAYMFYRPFPDRKLTGKDLLKMGMRGCRGDLAMVATMGTIGALLGLLTPLMTGLIFDNVIPEAERGQLMQMAFILVSCGLAVAMFDITKGIAMLRVEGKVDSACQAALWDRLMSLPVPFFRNFTAGDLANRSMGISQMRMILSGIAVNATLAMIFSSFNILLCFKYDWALALVGIGISTIGMICILTASYFQVQHQKKIMSIEGKNSGVILQFITGIAKLRISGTEDRAFAVWAKNFAQKKTHAFKAGTVGNVLASFNACFPVLAWMCIFMWVIWKSTSTLSPGDFLAFNCAYSAFQNAMLQMASVVMISLNVFPLYDRLKPIIQTEPETDDTKARPKSLSGHLEVSHVNFRYDENGPLILKDTSLAVSSGEFVALVGGSGSGKSTLMRLLLGFEVPESGSIYYDGQDLASTDLREIRRQIGVVLQNGTLMAGDLYKNIIGASNLTIDDAWEAARMVGVDADIEEMPMGMHTVIPAGGGTLSGGQRQRLLIARAVVKKPRILFFDEATSALDNKTQAIVSHSLESLRVTRIVIAHRLSTIINADRIHVMDKGVLIQSGTYDELINKEGLFAELAKRQIA